MTMDNESAIGYTAASMMGANVNNYDIGTYENSNFSKWSDCSFETPFVPMHREVSATNANPLKTKNDEKIRKNLFGNSYFSDANSSLQMMSSSYKSGTNEHDLTENRISQSQISK